MRGLKYEVVVVEGPVTVGCYQEAGEWYALAREFDLVGTGPSQPEAFRQLQELVSDYVESCIKEGTAEFMNPYEPDDWDRTRGARKTYLVTLGFGWRTRRRTSLRARVRPDELPTLSRFSRHFAGAGLMELQNAAV